MRKVNLIALAMLSIYLAAPLALGQGGTVEQQMTALNDQVKEANLKGDVSFYEKHYADDVVIVHSDGAAWRSRLWLASIISDCSGNEDFLTLGRMPTPRLPFTSLKNPSRSN